MSVRLIAVTKPVISEVDNAEGLILFIARVSSNQENTSTGLINFLIKHGHWSPFEHAHMTLEIITSRAIAQQILRHRSFTFQEFSQRYAEATNWVEYEARVKGDTNRQGSLETDDKFVLTWWNNAQRDNAERAFSEYHTALDLGIAPESARFILPLSTETKLYMTGSLRSWIHYLGDGPGGRTNEHTQKEHREIALQGQQIFCCQFPIIAEALGWTVPLASV